MTNEPTNYPVIPPPSEALLRRLSAKERERVLTGGCVYTRCPNLRITSRHCEAHNARHRGYVKKYYAKIRARRLRERRRAKLGLPLSGTPFTAIAHTSISPANMTTTATNANLTMRPFARKNGRYFFEENEAIMFPKTLAARIKVESSALHYDRPAEYIVDLFDHPERVKLLRAGLASIGAPSKENPRE